MLIENFKVGGLRHTGSTTKPAQARPAAGVLLDHRLRSGPARTPPGRLRLPDPGHRRADEPHRPAGAGEPGAGPYEDGRGSHRYPTGLYANVGILAALAHRERTGEGQHIDIALLDVQVACLANQAMNYWCGRSRRDSATAPQRRALPGFPDRRWRHDPGGRQRRAVREFLCRGRPAATRSRRAIPYKCQPGCESQGARVTAAQNDRAALPREWIALLERSGVPCGPINDLAAVFSDPHVRARQLQLDLPHPYGCVPSVADPALRNASRVPRGAADARRREMLREMPRSQAEIAGLHAQGCI